jgi:hypothetical protein
VKHDITEAERSKIREFVEKIVPQWQYRLEHLALQDDIEKRFKEKKETATTGKWPDLGAFLEELKANG